MTFAILARVQCACAVEVRHGDFVRLGATGEKVRRLQAALRREGLSASSTGVFDHDTEIAVRAFQRREHLVPEDGIAGPQLFQARLGRFGEIDGGIRRRARTRLTIVVAAFAESPQLNSTRKEACDAAADVGRAGDLRRYGPPGF
jgi:peptidoglycan hydrolase-like protein with peptidoglycan-binding domain